jgi:hypothetical protein
MYKLNATASTRSNLFWHIVLVPASTAPSSSKWSTATQPDATMPHEMGNMEIF